MAIHKDSAIDLQPHEELQTMIFPKRLIAILSDKANEDAIKWSPDGTAFIIVDRKLFVENVMPKFSPRKSKFSSFLRKLNRWGFSRVANGPSAGSYRHEFFIRDKPNLASQMYYHNQRTKEALKSTSIIHESERDKIAPKKVRQVLSGSANTASFNASKCRRFPCDASNQFLGASILGFEDEGRVAPWEDQRRFLLAHGGQNLELELLRARQIQLASTSRDSRIQSTPYFPIEYAPASFDRAMSFFPPESIARNLVPNTGRFLFQQNTLRDPTNKN